MSEIQEQVQAAVDELVASGAERGLQAAVYHRGQLVADAVAGVADAATGRAVASDTPFHATSTGKGVASTVIHVLVERGELDYDTRIAELWPEFGVHGKDRATVRHALTHTVGVPGVPVGTTPEDLCDWDRMCALIAGARPWWEPGTKQGYHPQTFGYIVGEIARRATGRPISALLRDLVAEPLGVADELYFGVPAAEQPRLARMEEAEGAMEMTPEMFAAMAEQVPFFRVVDGWTAAPPAAMPTADYCNRPDVLSADIPAGGVLSARAVARMYAALMDDVDGVRLISPARLQEVTAPAVSGTDEVVGFPGTRTLGYAIGFPGPLDSPTLFGMAGSGGTAAYADTATGIAVAVSKNRVSAGDYSTFNRIAEVVTKAI
ncbi:serine hydrolase domain-containing protein [Dactylosporangium fulvum]|uniref:Beta-lactamase family protein n=1 Tax=Dactylosporangium fulvum TaxID=53359 RepID=A0ABY5WDN2_9ACTN|nr:serine hydrolase domain-containing protein [Dactylosporangium fulvum]UWP86471.1 beta-lactamase family protein [Dactylosporangium fulvum]